MRNGFVLLLLLLPLAAQSQNAPADSRAQISIWLQEGAWDDILKSAAGAASGDTFLLQSAGYAAYQNGDVEVSRTYYNRVLMLDSNNRQALYISALLLKGDEQYGTAILLLARLCTAAPGVAQYQVLLADCYNAITNRAAALKALLNATTLAPSSATIAARLASTYNGLEQRDSAAAILSRAMLFHPGEPALISQAITVAYAQKRWRIASALADSLISTHKLRYEPMLTAIYADIESRNWKHAVSLGKALTALGGETEDVLYSAAYAQQKLGHWSAADSLLRRCVRKRLKPELERYYILLAEGAAEQKDWGRAAAYYDTAYYLFKNPLTLYSKGIMLNEAGHKPAASLTFRQYLALRHSRQDTAIARYMKQVMGE